MIIQISVLGHFSLAITLNQLVDQSPSTIPEKIAYGFIDAAESTTGYATLSATIYLVPGDIIRASQYSGGSTTVNVSFRITKVV